MDSDLNQQIPSYKDGVDDARNTYTTISQLLQQFSQVAASFKTNPAFAKLTAITDYAAGAAARADDARKNADAEVDGIAHLGALTELDEFKQQLKSKAIIVMGDSGYKILQFDQIWKVPESSRFAAQSPDVQPKLSFAGEQQITAAIAIADQRGQTDGGIRPRRRPSAGDIDVARAAAIVFARSRSDCGTRTSTLRRKTPAGNRPCRKTRFRSQRMRR